MGIPYIMYTVYNIKYALNHYSAIHRGEMCRSSKARNDRIIFGRLHGNWELIIGTDPPHHSQAPQMLLDRLNSLFKLVLYSLYSSSSHMWVDFSPCSCSQIHHTQDRTHTHVQQNSEEDDSSRRRLRGHWVRNERRTILATSRGIINRSIEELGDA